MADISDVGVVGFLLCRLGSISGSIEKLCVAVSYRRRGIGTSLLKAALEAMRKVRPSTSRSRGVYPGGLPGRSTREVCVPMGRIASLIFSDTLALQKRGLLEARLHVHAGAEGAAASALYARHGFVVEDTIRGYYSPLRDAHRMLLPLSSEPP